MLDPNTAVLGASNLKKLPGDPIPKLGPLIGLAVKEESMPSLLYLSDLLSGPTDLLLNL